MQTAPVRDQVESVAQTGTLDLRGGPQNAVVDLKVHSSWLKIGFALSLIAYLIVKLAGVVANVPPAAELVLLPGGVCAIGLGLTWRTTPAGIRAVEDEEEDSTLWPGIAAGVLLVAFTATYLAINTVPMVSAQDESAIVNGGHALATTGSLQVTSPLNDRYHTNIIGQLHVTYRTSTEMYYRTFPGTAVLYAPFSVLPDDFGYRLFTATFGTVAIVALYLSGWKLLQSWWGGLAGALVFAVSPAFGHWAVIVFNNVPVLALELSALAVVLWAPRERTVWFCVAGALMSLAFFARITEIVFVLPVFVLVFWRTRALRPLAAFGAAGLAGVALVVITNQVFYGDPLFLPQVGSWIPLLPGSQPASSQVLLESYAQFATGAHGSVSNFSWLEKLDHEWFHVRYLASSTFAFPFLPLAFAGLAWRLAAGKRDIWLLAGAIFTVALAILAIYGQKNDYYGVGQSIVRSSFVRYSLPVYALLSVAAGAFLLDTGRVFRAGTLTAMLPFTLIAIVVTVGVAHSYDSSVYGFNRLNGFRQDDRAAWSEVESFLDTNRVRPLVIGGPSAEKLVDSKYELYFINYDPLTAVGRWAVIEPVVEQAVRERNVYFVASNSNAADKALLDYLYATFTPKEVLRTGAFSVTLWRMHPAQYELFAVDVWNTSGAFDRWSLTADGYLESNAESNYVQLVQVDGDGDGRVDQDVTLEIELLDSGPDEFTISGLDSREGSRPPVPLVSGPLNQTGTWRTVTFSLRMGEHLRSQLDVSPGLTIRSIKVVAVGTK